MTDSHETIGTAKAALVVGQGPAAKAVISHVIARPMEMPSRWRLRFTGPVQFSNPTKSHIRRTILPIIDRIMSSIQVPNRHFELSAANLSAASALDMNTRISGFSADVAVFLALLSAGLQIPLADNFVATGHIASGHGDIRAVKGIPEKVRAVEQDPAVSCFIHPDSDQDQSMKVLSPNERDRGLAAIMGVQDRLKIRAVRGIDEVIREVFTEENILLASLRERFFDVTGDAGSYGGPLARTIEFLAKNHKHRFWRTLDVCFRAGQGELGKCLLARLVDFQITAESYNPGLGNRLLNLIRSLPPAVRRLKIEFPLLDTGLCLKLGTLAREADYPDVLKLLDAVHGKAIEPVEPVSLTEPSSAIAVSDADCAAFDAVVTQINEYALAHRFGIPIDSARGSYSLDASTVPSREAFLDLQEAFYIHLQNWINDETGPSPDTQHARSEVIGLMDEAFKDQGGHEAAYARARDGTQGGLRSVLDTVAEQYKRTCYSNYVRKVFYETVSVMEWDQRVRFMQGAMERLRPFLPPELRDEPPERFVRENGAIVKCYVESLDRLNRVFRTL